MSTLIQDLRYGIRLIRRAPAFTAAAVFLLALGIGGNATIFTLINTVLIRPLPGIDSSRLVVFSRTMRGEGTESNHAIPNFRDYAARNKVLDDIAAFDSRAFSYRQGNVTERVKGALVSDGYFSTHGVRVAHGRGIKETEIDAIVISHHFWREKFGGSADALGKAVFLNGNAMTVAGIAAEGFRGTLVYDHLDIWAPLTAQPLVDQGVDMLEVRASSMINISGRLKPGVGLGEAQANFNVITAQLAAEFPVNKGRGVRLQTWTPMGIVDGDVTQYLAIFVAMAGLALIIVCANVANLLLSRAAVRQKEISIRLALGAGRLRLLRQMLTEGVLLSLLAAAAGIVATFWTSDLLLQLMPIERGERFVPNLAVDGRVIGFAVALALVSTLFFALTPALFSLRTSPPRRNWLRNGLVLTQIALCVVLIVGAGVLSRSLNMLQKADPKLNARDLLLAEFDAGSNGYQRERAQQLADRLERAVRETPGVRGVTLAYMVPFTGGGFSMGNLVGGAFPQGVRTDMNLVGAGYHATLGIPMVRGREFTDADGAGAPKVAIVNETAARKFWPDGEALGRVVTVVGDKAPVLIVGIARDSRYRELTQAPRTMVYFPRTQHNWERIVIHVRTGGDPLALVPAVREAVRGVDPNLPLYNIRSMQMQIAESFAPQRMAATLMGAFGGLAIVLAAFGLYAVMAFQVTQRTREIGIRMALGATRENVLGGSMKNGLVLALAGLGPGFLMSVALTRTLAFMLYGVSPFDPITFAGAGVLLVAVALLACYLPARRAASVDPMVALRYE